MIIEDTDEHVKSLKFVRTEAMERYLATKDKRDKGIEIDYLYENIQIKNTNQIMASIMAEIHAVNANNNQIQVIGKSTLSIPTTKAS